MLKILLKTKMSYVNLNVILDFGGVAEDASVKKTIKKETSAKDLEREKPLRVRLPPRVMVITQMKVKSS